MILEYDDVIIRYEGEDVIGLTILHASKAGKLPTSESIEVPAPEAKTPPRNSFDVAAEFPGYPPRSVELAQIFVNTALSIRGVRADRNDHGIGFDPNFVFVEHLHKREPGALTVSFYGQPSRHKNALLKKGRGSYSRAQIHDRRELDSVLPHIERAYILKLGSLPGR